MNNEKNIQELLFARKSVVEAFKQKKLVSFVAVQQLRDLDEQIKAVRRGRSLA